MYRISTYYAVFSIQPFQVYFVNTFPHLRPINFWTIRFSFAFVLREHHALYKLVVVLYHRAVFSHNSVSNSRHHVAVHTGRESCALWQWIRPLRCSKATHLQSRELTILTTSDAALKTKTVWEIRGFVQYSVCLTDRKVHFLTVQ